MKIHVIGAAMVLGLTATVLTARVAPASPDEAVAKINQLIKVQLD